MELHNETPIRILMAEDDEDDQDFFKLALAEVNSAAELKIMTDGQALMKHLDSIGDVHPDILFLDINMPIKSGDICLKEIRSNATFDKLPVVVFTTSQSPNDIRMLYDYGANLFVTKPTKIESLKIMLEKIFELHYEKNFIPPKKSSFLMGVNSGGVYWRRII